MCELPADEFNRIELLLVSDHLNDWVLVRFQDCGRVDPFGGLAHEFFDVFAYVRFCD
jgi:hypothetical protein